MISVNRATIMGYLGKDAETRYTQSGVPVTEFSVATTQKWRDDSGESHEKTEWHNCVMWRREGVVPYLTSGQPLYVEGSLETQSWEDRESGKRRYKTVIIVEFVSLLNRGSRGPRDEQAPPPRNRGEGVEPRRRHDGGSVPEDPGGPPAGPLDDEDVPF